MTRKLFSKGCSRVSRASSQAIDGSRSEAVAAVGREASSPSEEDGAVRWSLDHLSLTRMPFRRWSRSSCAATAGSARGGRPDARLCSECGRYFACRALAGDVRGDLPGDGLDPTEVLSEVVADVGDPEQFWTRLRPTFGPDGCGWSSSRTPSPANSCGSSSSLTGR